MSKKEAIFSAAYELFSTNKFKSVSIADIARFAGISVGTFYNYYLSKEALFLEIYTNENRKAKEYIMRSSDKNALPSDVVQHFMLLNTETIKNNCILQEWYGDDIGEELRNHFQNKSVCSLPALREFVENILEGWRKKSILRDDISNEEILLIFDALSYLDIYASKATSQSFSNTITWLAKFTAIEIMKNKEVD